MHSRCESSPMSWQPPLSDRPDLRCRCGGPTAATSSTGIYPGPGIRRLVAAAATTSASDPGGTSTRTTPVDANIPGSALRPASTFGATAPGGLAPAVTRPGPGMGSVGTPTG